MAVYKSPLKWLKVSLVLIASSLYIATPLPVSAAVAQLNFQPTGSSIPAGYLKDDGSTYTTARGYGWISGSVYTRDRDTNPDQRLDTFLFTDGVATWQYDIPNGSYVVSFASGDASNQQGPHRVVAEGVVAINNVPTGANQFITVTALPVTVSDSKLTITIGGGGGAHTMLNYLTINAQ